MELKWLVWQMYVWLTSPPLIKSSSSMGTIQGGLHAVGETVPNRASRDGVTEAFTTEGILNRPNRTID